MRRTLSLVLAIIATPAFAKPVYNSAADVQAITRIEKTNANELNINAVIANYSSNAVLYDFAGPGIFKGHDQIISEFSTRTKPVKNLSVSFPSINVFSDGAMACAAVQMVDEVTLKTGAKSQLSLRQLDVLRKVNGKWRVVQEHISVPTDPKTSLALTDAPVTPATPIEFPTNPFAGPRGVRAGAQAQIKDWTVAFADAPSADAVLKLMGPGDHLLIFDMFFPAPVQGQKALLTAYAPGFAQLASASVSFDDFNADSDGYIGAQIDTQRLAVKLKNGGTMVWTLRQSDCLHQVGGRWFSVFDALSFPLDVKTGKAVMN